MSTSYIQDEAAGAHAYLTHAGHDHKAWAKRIIYREERRDPTVTALQVRFAREALDLPTDKTKA